jgi:hypothetical protein
MLIPHGESLENQNFCAVDISVAPTLETKEDPTHEHESLIFGNHHSSCSFLSPKLIMLSTMCLYEDPNLLSILVHKLFRRMVVDAYVYNKYCKSRVYTLVLTLQLEHSC